MKTKLNERHLKFQETQGVTFLPIEVQRHEEYLYYTHLVVNCIPPPNFIFVHNLTNKI